MSRGPVVDLMRSLCTMQILRINGKFMYVPSVRVIIAFFRCTFVCVSNDPKAYRDAELTALYGPALWIPSYVPSYFRAHR